MARQIPPFGLRMPDEVKDWIKEKARREGRSMNSQIVQMLREKKEAELAAS
ncbi:MULTISPECIES: Arc family DNA-binding protein [Paracoccus]|uniref:Arc family DNA-binding protein n=1 Tax=Paracoccus denitrificans TaxID=266 RepID=UPI001E44F5A9|nr:Arc family DNA-binding protein [Paracoccus denitrificans]UFS64871.1 Arc family DNA-binding protein [Paracoccus denitrificans]